MGVSRANNGLKAGDWKFHASSVVPAGWLKMNGALLLRANYPALFAVLGTTWNTGGELATEFRVPDMRGRFPRGLDDGAGVDLNRILGTYQADENRSHAHTGSTSTDGLHAHNQHPNALHNADHAGLYAGGSFGNQGYTTDAQGNHAHSFTTNATGGSETRPKNAAFLAIIKY
jgi:microcystin-dependent protein